MEITRLVDYMGGIVYKVEIEGRCVVVNIFRDKNGDLHLSTDENTAFARDILQDYFIRAKIIINEVSLIKENSNFKYYIQ